MTCVWFLISIYLFRRGRGWNRIHAFGRGWLVVLKGLLLIFFFSFEDNGSYCLDKQHALIAFLTIRNRDRITKHSKLFIKMAYRYFTCEFTLAALNLETSKLPVLSRWKIKKCRKSILIWMHVEHKEYSPWLKIGQWISRFLGKVPLNSTRWLPVVVVTCSICIYSVECTKC
jgi:hypothetical protein